MVYEKPVGATVLTSYMLYKYINLYNAQHMWFGVHQLVVTVVYYYVCSVYT